MMSISSSEPFPIKQEGLFPGNPQYFTIPPLFFALNQGNQFELMRKSDNIAGVCFPMQFPSGSEFMSQ